MNVLTFIWGMDLFYYLLIFLVPSFLFGAVIIDLTKTTVYMAVSLFLGVVISVGVLSFPSLALGDSDAIGLVFTYISKYFILSIFPSLAGTITGSFIGDALSNRTEFETLKI